MNRVFGSRTGLISLLASLVALSAIVCGCVSVTGDGPVSTIVFVDRAGSSVAPILGLILDQDYRVVGLVTEGAAEKTGVQVGDAIKQVNGQEITGGNPSLKIFRNLDRSKPVQLVLERGQEELEVELIPLPPPVPQAPPGMPPPTATPAPPGLLYF